MERLTDESAKKRRQLDHETTDTLTAQIELDKTAEDFRKAHIERQELIRQWENTIEQMQRRDKEMDLLAAVRIFIIYYLSRVRRKPDFCLCENKGADQLRSNCTADQRLCFRYTDSTISLLFKSEISSF